MYCSEQGADCTAFRFDGRAAGLMSMASLRWGCTCWVSAGSHAAAPWPCLQRTLTHLPSLRVRSLPGFE